MSETLLSMDDYGIIVMNSMNSLFREFPEAPVELLEQLYKDFYMGSPIPFTSQEEQDKKLLQLLKITAQLREILRRGEKA